jgi:hypothetical protein
MHACVRTQILICIKLAYHRVEVALKMEMAYSSEILVTSYFYLSVSLVRGVLGKTVLFELLMEKEGYVNMDAYEHLPPPTHTIT